MIFPSESKRKCGPVFSLGFLFGCYLPLKKAFCCRKEDVECLHVACYLLSNYGIFKISTQQKKNVTYRKTLCNCNIQMLSS